MAFVPKYQARLLKPVILQLIAIIQRDQRAALDWVAGTSVLGSIVTYQMSPMTIPQYPAILAAPMDSDFNRDAQGSQASINRLYIAIAVTHQDANVVAELVQDYLTALNAIMVAVEPFDFYQSLPLSLPINGSSPTSTTPLVVGSVKDLFVSRHDYGAMRRLRSGFDMAGVLELLIDREEV